MSIQRLAGYREKLAEMRRLAVELVRDIDDRAQGHLRVDGLSYVPADVLAEDRQPQAGDAE
ncbi:hypothetical protein [Sphaerisporangium album]|nr:hypothetical protein [Sphaerisporangium album]